MTMWNSTPRLRRDVSPPRRRNLNSRKPRQPKIVKNDQKLLKIVKKSQIVMMRSRWKHEIELHGMEHFQKTLLDMVTKFLNEHSVSSDINVADFCVPGEVEEFLVKLGQERKQSQQLDKWLDSPKFSKQEIGQENVQILKSKLLKRCIKTNVLNFDPLRFLPYFKHIFQNQEDLLQAQLIIPGLLSLLDFGTKHLLDVLLHEESAVTELDLVNNHISRLGATFISEMFQNENCKISVLKLGLDSNCVQA